MTTDEKKQVRVLRLIGAGVYSGYKGGIYFLSFLGPVLIIHHFQSLPVALLLVLTIVGIGFAGLSFLVLLVATKKFLIGPVKTAGMLTIHTSEGKRWFSAAMLGGVLYSSPFRSMTTGLSLFASWYHRGMGAKMPSSVLVGNFTRIVDPWFLEVGENVNIGGDSVILGHLGHGREIFLGKVVIGDGVVIGGRTLILPDVRIGSYARVGAGAVVVRGTVIPDGETWAGVPARKITARPVEG